MEADVEADFTGIADRYLLGGTMARDYSFDSVNLMYFLAVISLATGCSSNPQSGNTGGEAEVIFNIPGFDSFSTQIPSQKSLPGQIRSQSFDLSTGWGLEQPTSIADITCYALAIDWPESSANSNRCKKGDSQFMVPGLFQGLYLPGAQVSFKVPAGQNRKIYLIGFAAASASSCVALDGRTVMPREWLSAPLVLGQVSINLQEGTQTLTIEPSLATAEPVQDCNGPIFDGGANESQDANPSPAPIPGRPVSAPSPTNTLDSLPNIIPRANAMSCRSPSLIGRLAGEVACYGLWDFGDAFGNDQHMCSGAGESAYSSPAPGCKIPTIACASGLAVASQVLNIYQPWDQTSDGVDLANETEVEEIATHLNTAPTVIRQQLIRIWKYTCTTPSDEIGVPTLSPSPLPNLTTIPVSPPTPAPQAPPPGVNDMNCSNQSATGLSNGSLSCYGLWDYGSAFGNDINMCAASEGSSPYSEQGVGCRVNAPACESGVAEASNVLAFNHSVHSVVGIPLGMTAAAKLSEIAQRLNTTTQIVSRELVRVWEYRCVAP